MGVTVRVTLKDIARHTGLSVATVSLVLNNKVHRLSTETKEKVLKAAKELRYRPNQLAVGLVTRRTRTIGLVIPDVTNMFFAVIAKGAQICCQKRGYHMILCNTNDSPDKDLEAVEVLMDRGVDGVLMTISSAGSKARECLETLERMEKPLVLIDRVLPETGASAVLSDNELGGYIATRHLLELGHRRIGCISAPMALTSSKMRVFGYIRALQEYAVAFDPALMEEAPFQLVSDFALVRRLLDAGATAIFAYNDLMAYGVYKLAVEAGLRIPQDFSLVGYDNLFFSELLEVPLTTVSQPVLEMGEAAANLLVDRIEGADDTGGGSVCFKPELVVRRSAGPPGGQR